MGDVLDPKPPQWQRKVALEDVPEDRVLMLTNALMAVVNSDEIDSTLVQLVAIRLILKGVVGNYRAIVGHDAARELMRQAAEMAEQYTIKGVDEHFEPG
jgi:hypothetical protein